MNSVTYTDSAESIRSENIEGFFVGWDTKPSPEKHLQLLQKSTYYILAKDGEKIVGFITAITDQTLAAYIPFLEVLPEYQKQGIGQELVKRMLVKLDGYYMVDLLCDPEIQPFYEKLGMKKAVGMIQRNYKNQDGD